MNHEKLICYRKSLNLAGELAQSIAIWPKGYGYLSDQIKRAMASVLLNCAEGNARFGRKERRHFFQIARASAIEVAACLDLIQVYGLGSSDQNLRWKDDISQITKMFFALK